MTLVKICGIRDLVTAQTAVAAGAEFLGFVVNVPSSPRSVEVCALIPLVNALEEDRSNIKLMGVFVEQKAAEVLAIAQSAHLDGVQLQGRQSPEDCRLLRAAGLLVWKSFGVGSEDLVQRVKSFVDEVDGIHLDTQIDGKTGGTGTTFAWTLAHGIKRYGKPIILAGGLNPGNVQAAIATIHPDIVDVSSGVESSRGIKDNELIRQFIRTAKAVV